MEDEERLREIVEKLTNIETMIREARQGFERDLRALIANAMLQGR